MFPNATQQLATVTSPRELTLNSQHGDSWTRLMFEANKDVYNPGYHGFLKRFIGNDGRSYEPRPRVDPRTGTIVTNEKTGAMEYEAFVVNAPALLPLYAWQAFDDVVVRALRFRLRAMAAVRAAGLEKTVPNAMGKTVLIAQNSTDVGPATVSMDPARRSETDRQQLDTTIFPLAIVHKDMDFNRREIMASMNAGVNGVNFPIDTEGAESAAYAVASTIDQLLLGTAGSYTAGGGTIYGFTNFPQRVTKTNMVTPDGTNGVSNLNDFLSMRQSLIALKHFGPYQLFLSTDWTQFLDQDFKTYADQTLRQRILATGAQDGIGAVITCDQLPTGKFDCALVEMLPRTVRAIVGFEAQTVQWESMGGMMQHMKVMAMILGQIRPDTAGFSGVAHGKNAP
jgi:hypothetical protein